MKCQNKIKRENIRRPNIIFIFYVGLKIIKNSSFKDNRGFYWTTWKKGIFKNLNLIMTNFLYQKKKVLRGLHCDFKSWKLVTCTFGKVFLVVNMKKIQKNYLKHKTWILKHEKPTLILIPPHFANIYVCQTNVFFTINGPIKENMCWKNKKYRWNDPKLKIKWPIKTNIK